MEEREEEDNGLDLSEEEQVVLPPEPIFLWSSGNVTFEGLGRDVLQVISRYLNARDCFCLAMTSHKTYERLKLLRKLNFSAAERFLSLYPKSKPKCLNLVPLVIEMLSNPLPLERLAPVPPSSRTCIVICLPQHVYEVCGEKLCCFSLLQFWNFFLSLLKSDLYFIDWQIVVCFPITLFIYLFFTRLISLFGCSRFEDMSVSCANLKLELLM